MKPPHVLVLGGTKGIGLTVARRLAAAGQAVSVVGRSDLSNLQGVRAWRADVTDHAALDRALSEAASAQGPVSGIVLLQRYRGDGDEWSGEIATSLTATRHALEWAEDHLEDRGDGKSVVVIGSVAGTHVVSEQGIAYHMAKAAIAQMVRYYAVQLGPRGIRVNTISPGTIVKDESRAFYTEHGELEQLYRDIVPLGRMGNADDVADVALWLLSRGASFVTGQNIILDGGASLHGHESLARRASPLRDLQVSRSPRRRS